MAENRSINFILKQTEKMRGCVAGDEIDHWADIDEIITRSKYMKSETQVKERISKDNLPHKISGYVGLANKQTLTSGIVSTSLPSLGNPTSLPDVENITVSNRSTGPMDIERFEMTAKPSTPTMDTTQVGFKSVNDTANGDCQHPAIYSSVVNAQLQMTAACEDTARATRTEATNQKDGPSHSRQTGTNNTKNRHLVHLVVDTENSFTTNIPPATHSSTRQDGKDDDPKAIHHGFEDEPDTGCWLDPLPGEEIIDITLSSTRASHPEYQLQRIRKLAAQRQREMNRRANAINQTAVIRSDASRRLNTGRPAHRFAHAVDGTETAEQDQPPRFSRNDRCQLWGCSRRGQSMSETRVAYVDNSGIPTATLEVHVARARLLEASNDPRVRSKDTTTTELPSETVCCMAFDLHNSQEKNTPLVYMPGRYIPENQKECLSDQHDNGPCQCGCVAKPSFSSKKEVPPTRNSVVSAGLDNVLNDGLSSRPFVRHELSNPRADKQKSRFRKDLRTVREGLRRVGQNIRNLLTACTRES